MRNYLGQQRAQEGGATPRKKRLGGYLVEAGLLTPAQVDMVLHDQKATGMRFGEILAARGWVKQQTIEYLMEKVVLPEREALQPGTEDSLDTEFTKITMNDVTSTHDR